jgi:hypothetical protein
MSMEFEKLQNNLNERNSDMNNIQEDISKRKVTYINEYVEKLKNIIVTLENKKIELHDKIEFLQLESQHLHD